ncbi:hypothetical protein FPV67DRAFT_1665550 [Lyophyllum atratum]|nr:hypothetical protein FPV67DRAFT_1665550 [Lyophyllum atratum]
MSERDVQLKLVEEVAERDQMEGTNGETEYHPTVMIANGLALREDQYVDMADLGLHLTSNQLSRLLEPNQLRRRIVAWIDVQNLFLPDAARLRAKEAQKAGPNGLPVTKAQEIKLWLPSELKKEGVVVSDELQGYEWRLQEGQANDALEDIYSPGVKVNTRSNVAIETVNQSIKKTATKYRNAQQALVTLSKNRHTPVWETVLCPLQDSDIRGLSEGLFGDSVGNKKTSWIWSALGVVTLGEDDPALNDALCIEWCCTRARAMRWAEEVELLTEEMRRVSAFLKWKAGWWLVVWLRGVLQFTLRKLDQSWPVIDDTEGVAKQTKQRPVRAGPLHTPL